MKLTKILLFLLLALVNLVTCAGWMLLGLIGNVADTSLSENRAALATGVFLSAMSLINAIGMFKLITARTRINRLSTCIAIGCIAACLLLIGMAPTPHGYGLTEGVTLFAPFILTAACAVTFPAISFAQPSNQCGSCGYSLIGLPPNSKCPECGSGGR